MPDRPGFVDSLLFALVETAQRNAESAYLDALAAGPYPDRLDGIAEGLAVAVALLGGDQPAVVREKATDELARLRELDARDHARAGDALRRLRAARAV